MIKRVLDHVMQRRAKDLLALIDGWVPRRGQVLDLGSGTGHAAWLLSQADADVVTADVSDIHVAGPTPVLIGDGVLPFDDDAFAATLMLFMLAYPDDPVAVLKETGRVTYGPVIVVQTVYRGWIGKACHRARELFWTVFAFHASRAVGYVPAGAKFSMRTRRFYTPATLAHDVADAGLRVMERRIRRLLPKGTLEVVAWRLERND